MNEENKFAVQYQNMEPANLHNLNTTHTPSRILGKASPNMFTAYQQRGQQSKQTHQKTPYTHR